MIERALSNSTIEELLDARMEHESLDYKEMLDPTSTRSIVELAKDVAAMANTRGGYIVFGVNKYFERVGISQELKLDEADLRNKIHKYFPDVEFYCKEYYDAENKRYFIIFVPEQDSVFPAIEGKYRDRKNREKIVFKPGELLIRDGSQSRPANSKEFNNFIKRIIFDKRVEHIKKVEKIARYFNVKSRPDRIQEKLLSNVFLIKKIPNSLYLATTEFTLKKDIFKLYENIPPEFILKENKLITFYNLEKENNPLRNLVDCTSIERVRTEEYIKDENRWRYIVELLNLNLKSHCKLIGLVFDGKRYFFPAPLSGKMEIEWRPRGKKRSKRKVVEEYHFKGKKYYLHRGARIKTTKIENDFFLIIDPCIVITEDGITPTKSEKLRSKYQSFSVRSYNSHLINDIYFWSALLKGRNRDIIIKNESYEIIISAHPIKCTIPIGFSEDKITKKKEDVDLNLSEIITFLSTGDEIHEGD